MFSWAKIAWGLGLLLGLWSSAGGSQVEVWSSLLAQCLGRSSVPRGSSQFTSFHADDLKSFFRDEIGHELCLHTDTFFMGGWGVPLFKFSISSLCYLPLYFLMDLLHKIALLPSLFSIITSAIAPPQYFKSLHYYMILLSPWTLSKFFSFSLLHGWVLWVLFTHTFLTFYHLL